MYQMLQVNLGIIMYIMNFFFFWDFLKITFKIVL